MLTARDRAKVACAGLLAGMLAAVMPAPAFGQAYPAKPVKLIVGFPPGGGSDALARLLAAALTDKVGQQILVDNRAGANTIVATQFVQSQPPDGYTLLFVSASFAINPSLYKLTYDIEKDFTPVAIVAIVPLLLIVNNDSPAKSVKELIAMAKSQPGKLTYASFGAGSAAHLAGEMLLGMTGTNMIHVPYKGDAPAITDLLGGQIQLYFGGPLVLSPHMNAGKLRGLAVTSEQRSKVLPDLPAVNEVVPGYTAVTWFGMWAPPGTPKTIVDKLNQSVARILARPDVQERLRNDGMDAAHNTPEEFSRYVARDIAKWTKVVKAGNIRGD
jgi:tripartite-type tricarboxylate transporter receptor subunit TctC